MLNLTDRIENLRRCINIWGNSLRLLEKYDKVCLDKNDVKTEFNIISNNIIKNVHQPQYFLTDTDYVYVLALEDDKYYVGTSKDLHSRLYQHFNGSGARWTKLHKPIYVYEVTLGGRNEERIKTLEIMRKHGWENTRGAVWSVCDMKNPPKELSNESTNIDELSDN